MCEISPTGKTVGQCEGFAGAVGGGSRRLRIDKPHLAGKRGNDYPGLGYPRLDVNQAGQALAKAPGDGIGRLALGKPLRDFKNIAEPPAANG